MNDKELLELAAKAAGMELTTRFGDGFRARVGEHDSFEWWNPLDNDGDALRLAVKLNVFNTAEQFLEFQGFYSDEITKSGMPTAATRRAIVTIAAHLGKSQLVSD